MTNPTPEERARTEEWRARVAGIEIRAAEDAARLEMEVHKIWADKVCSLLGFPDDDLPSAEEAVEAAAAREREACAKLTWISTHPAARHIEAAIRARGAVP